MTEVRLDEGRFSLMALDDFAVTTLMIRADDPESSLCEMSACRVEEVEKFFKRRQRHFEDKVTAVQRHLEDVKASAEAFKSKADEILSQIRSSERGK